MNAKKAVQWVEVSAKPLYRPLLSTRAQPAQKRLALAVPPMERGACGLVAQQHSLRLNEKDVTLTSCVSFKFPSTPHQAYMFNLLKT